MKILVVGGNGLIGSNVVKALKKNVKNEVLTAGRNSGDFSVDISNSESIKSLFEKIGKIDAIVNIAGDAKWDSFSSLTEEDYYIGIKSKLMGQVNLTRIGQHFLNNGGSITLTTGILADYPVPLTASAAMVNGAVHSFVKATSLEIGNNIRINVVSASLLEEAVSKYGEYFKGQNPVPMKDVLKGYEESIFGKNSGKVIRIYNL